jgi:hypothetical protein
LAQQKRIKELEEILKITVKHVANSKFRECVNKILEENKGEENV